MQLSSGGLGMLAALGQAKLAVAAPTDYKALVCLFMLGGNDGHNMVVPMASAQYNAYRTARGGLALNQNQLLGFNDAAQGAFGFHYSMPEIQALYTQGRASVLSNVGMLVQPTTYANQSTPGWLPSNLRSHSDQVTQMQTAYPNSGSSTGWGGRALDLMETTYGYNAGSNFPASISMNSPALFCTGATVQGTSLIPGNHLDQDFLGIYPPTAAAARLAALNQIVTTNSGNSIVDYANRSMRTALSLNPILKGAAGSVAFQKAFPGTSLGNQLKEIARYISLNAQLGVGRQVFFCSLGAFDTHGGQSYQQQVNLQEVSQALDAFYWATNQLGLDQKVTAFTMSDFGRTLQPSGSGTDHGWGNHHLIVGGAVQGGRMFGRFPLMTNYANFNSTADDFSDARGVMLPSTSLSQYAATLSQWFGASNNNLDAMFPTLQNFANRNLGFV